MAVAMPVPRLPATFFLEQTIPNPQSAIRNPQFNPQSAIRNPQSAIRNQ